MPLGRPQPSKPVPGSSALLETSCRTPRRRAAACQPRLTTALAHCPSTPPGGRLARPVVLQLPGVGHRGVRSGRRRHAGPAGLAGLALLLRPPRRAAPGLPRRRHVGQQLHLLCWRVQPQQWGGLQQRVSLTRCGRCWGLPGKGRLLPPLACSTVEMSVRGHVACFCLLLRPSGGGHAEWGASACLRLPTLAALSWSLAQAGTLPPLQPTARGATTAISSSRRLPLTMLTGEHPPGVARALGPGCALPCGGAHLSPAAPRHLLCLPCTILPGRAPCPAGTPMAVRTAARRPPTR